MLTKKTLFIIIGLVILLVSIPLTIYELQKNQIFSPHAAGPTCAIAKANCTWSPVSGATLYYVTISEQGGATIVNRVAINTPVTNYTFPAQAGKIYQCSVSAANNCGEGSSGSATASCTIGPTITQQIPTSTVIPTPTQILLPSVTQIPGTTPTETPAISQTPAPTNTPIPNATVTPTIAATQVPGISFTPGPTSVVQPTIPPTGDAKPFVIIGITASTLIIAAFFLFLI